MKAEIARVKHRILVVDDDAACAHVICMVLSLQGHECHSTNSFEGALEKARELAPDVVMVDISLPDRSGLELAGTLRAIEHCRSMHLAVITGWSDQDVGLRCRAAGFDQYIVKPIDAKRLRRLIDVVDGIADA